MVCLSLGSVAVLSTLIPLSAMALTMALAMALTWLLSNIENTSIPEKAGWFCEFAAVNRDLWV